MPSGRVPWLAHLMLIAAGALVVWPFAIMVLTAFKSQHQVMVAGGFWPHPWVWGNFARVWQAAPFARYFFNSACVAVLTVGLQLFTASLAGFAFARLAFAGREVLFVLFLATLMVPQELTLIADYLLLSRLHWRDTYLALTIPWGASPIAIFLLRQTFKSLPAELHDAARLDGCSNWRFLWAVAVPLARPALWALALLGLVGSWNDFVWPLVMTDSEAMRTVQIGISYFAQDAGTEYPLLMAASTLVIAPMVVLFTLVQRPFIQGIAQSGLK